MTLEFIAKANMIAIMIVIKLKQYHYFENLLQDHQVYFLNTSTKYCNRNLLNLNKILNKLFLIIATLIIFFQNIITKT